jgi:hypothetical protein
MIKKWIFAAGAGIGYVLGTKAGREKYEKMRMQARQVLDNPTVKDATDAVQTEAGRLKDGGIHAFRERMRKISHRDRTDRPELGADVEPTTSTATTQDVPPLTAPSTPSATTTKPTNQAGTTPEYPPRG